MPVKLSLDALTGAAIDDAIDAETFAFDTAVDAAAEKVAPFDVLSA